MKKFITLICAAFLLFIWSCSEDTIEVVLYGNLTGKVVDKISGESLDNVKITTNPASTTVFTDTSGTFKIDRIPVDDYSVQAELTGYSAGFEAVSVSENNTSTVSFELSIANTKNKPPTTPELVSPADGEVELPLEVTFTWEASDPDGDELSYTLDLRNGTTDEMEVFEIVRDTSYTVQNLQLATKYFWQVTATDGENDPVSSTISEFKTLVLPDNPYIFVKEKNGNLVIHSGAKSDTVTGGTTVPDFNVLQLTSENQNSFRPKKSTILNKIAFLRNSGGNTHIYTMNYDGTDLRQITSQTPVAGFLIEEVGFTWAQNDSKLYYPYFDKLYSINSDGSGLNLEYTTTDGAFISEVAVPEFDNNLVLLKTNNSSGYDVRIYTARIDTDTEETIILENVLGAAGGIDISSNADKILYTKGDNEQNSSYKIFNSRIFLYTIGQPDQPVEVETNVLLGENDLDVKFSPSEGGIIFTRVQSNIGATPAVYSLIFDQQSQADQILFTNSFMPDWE
ncbi:carboxypeptidase regulatory-like domain-containing protein [Aequorivita capsosiphonis]|uniref:carboxypeptidase regulatory-like domain-containing protein n=1 Tax=Aequorivita capsosiphonis TaxID=487317 RepID=UPI00047D79B0|nr:carboxypeptidase regulatory-like domain-containing protein [Aequorivita capsosiphonis]